MDHLQSTVPSDDDDDDEAKELPLLLPSSSPFSPLAPMQMSNAYYDELDFDHGDSGTNSCYEKISVSESVARPMYKRLTNHSQVLSSQKRFKLSPASHAAASIAKGSGFESPEEGEISDDQDADAGSQLTVSPHISPSKRKSVEMESFAPSADADGHLVTDNVLCNGEFSSALMSDLDEMEGVLQNDNQCIKDSLNANDNEFEIIDDALSSDNGDDINVGADGGVYSDDETEGDADVDDDEIEAMLEGSMPSGVASDVDGKQKVTGGRGRSSVCGGAVDFQAPAMLEKVILVEKGQDPFDILPEGWLVVTHQSGMPIYLHKPTRVCTVSRPYFLGPGSARKHEIPLSAIPCLQYRRAMSEVSNVGDRVTNDATSVSLHDAAAAAAAAAAPSSVSFPDTSVTTDKEQNAVSSNRIDGTDVSALPAVRKMAIPTKVQSAEDHKKSNSLTPLEFRAYCQELFKFKTITVRRFRRWKDRRKHNILIKKASRPTLPPSTNLITCAIPADKDSHLSFRRKAFVLNPAGKSPVCILHEYAQHTMRIQPRYIFQELENSQMPYSATVVINEVQYGTGYATSKKMAKLEAAGITLKILIPEIGKVKTDEPTEDLSFFDEIKIEDPRVVDLCNKAGHPTPYQILGECLRRNYGMGDTQVQMDINTVKHQKSEFIMRVGRHEAKVICKNKREGKQQAAQAILQMMHSHIRTWGSLLRLYSTASEIKDKREEEFSVTKLQTMAHPNKAILEKLRQEMTKLYHKHDAFQSNIKGKLKVAAPETASSELLAVDI